MLALLLSRLLDLALLLVAMSATTGAGFLALRLILRGIEHKMRPRA
ncbi:MAG TPA: hypothetical protein VMV31_01635 [Terriglobales bacterium]|nr:hypothetical protein [Terriglobales bacterium]